MAYIPSSKRIFNMLFSGGRMLAPQLANFIISLVVIRVGSKETWGAVSAIVLWVNLGCHFSAWGNQDYLLRLFSEKPYETLKNWKNAFSMRFILHILLTILVFAGLSLDSEIKLIVIAWMLFKFITLSFDPIIVYEKKFSYSLFNETLPTLIVFTLSFWLIPIISVQQILVLFMITEILKSVFYLFLFRKQYRIPVSEKINLSYFKNAFPFFLISFTGLLQTRTDQLFVNHYLPDTDKAFYQVYMNLLILVLAIPSFMISPVLKNLYRSGEKMYSTISKKIMFSAFLFIPVGICTISFTLCYAYRFEVKPILLIAGTAYVLPAYYFSIWVYRLFHLNKQKVVTIINLTGIVVNATLSYLFIPAYGLTGGIIAAATGQWCMLLLYKIAINKISETSLANET